MFRQRLVTAGKIVVILVWAALFVTLLQRDYFVKRLSLHENEVLEKASQESFAGVYFKDERIGYVKNDLRRGDDGYVHLTQEAVLNLFVLQKNYPVELQAQARLSADFLLRDFTFAMSSPFYTMQASGQVTGKRVDFTLVNGKEKISDSVTLNSPPYLSLNQRGYLLRQGLQTGDKVKVAYFDPLTLSGKDTVIEYRGLVKTLIKNRVYLLHHFEEDFAGIRINSWLDDNGKVVKEESPAGFIFLSEPEFQARDISRKGQDILQSVAVPFQGDLSQLAEREEISYRLELPEATGFDLDGGRQQWRNGILTIHREKMAADNAMICQGREDDLTATPYIQSDHAKIKALADRITAQITSPLGRVKAIARWVYENLQKRPVIGIPDAVATLERGMGDCNEHAVLFAALARSAGIPTRIASGVTFHAGAFYYHAWNEVCVGNEWLSLDTTTGQLTADLGHIRFVIGETKEQVKIGALLGNLKILPVK